MKWIATVLLMLACVTTLRADYIEDRRAADALHRAGKYEEALAAFQAMAASASSNEQKSDALAQAVRSASALKRDDLAMELAQQIPSKPVSITWQMILLEGQRKYREAIDQFGAEDIEAWPDSAKAQGSFARGRIYFALKDGKNAEADLKRAIEFINIANDKALALNNLGDTYSALLKDRDAALATYRRTYETGSTYKMCQAALSASGILSSEGKHEEAIAELGRIDMKTVEFGLWRAMMFAGWGRVYAAAGQKDKAIENFNQALATEGIQPHIKTQVEKALAALQGEQPQTQPSTDK